MGKIADFFYIVKDKITKGFVKIKNALSNFFHKALSMLKTVVHKLASKVRGAIMGCTHFVRKIGNKYQEGTRTYSLDQEIGEWYETTVVKDIELSDVPREYVTMDDEFEIDDTKELDMAIAM